MILPNGRMCDIDMVLRNGGNLKQSLSGAMLKFLMEIRNNEKLLCNL